MATDQKTDILTNRQIMMMAAKISAQNMKIIAREYMGLEKEMVDELEAENIEDKEAFKRAVIKKWANMNSDQQVEKLAVLLYDSAKRNLVDATKVRDILGVSEDLGLAAMAEKLRIHTSKTTRIEMAPWAKAYTVDVKDIYTDLTLEKIENEPTGPESKTVKDYKELFEDNNEQTTEMSDKKIAKKVLMKADPGMGKTTFGKQLAYDWAKGLFTAFTIIFFVSLKLVRPGDAIENIIIQQTPVLAGLGVKQEQIGTILNTFSNRCLIIFDGYDEFKSKNDDIMKIIEGRKLFHCNIVLTSRPHNVENIEEYFSTVVVIQGFSEMHTSQYISKVLKGQDKVQAVIQFNKNNFMADRKQFTCPMLILFICILANHDELDLARKNVALGEIYWRLLRSIYRKYCEKAGVQFKHSHFVDVVTRVSFLAYRMFGLEQTCFQRSDIPEVSGEDIFEYGFLIGYEDYRLVGHEAADIAVGFPHDTIGEFFAAFCEMYRLNNCHWIDNFFLQHVSLLHFCLWLITDLQMDIGFDKKATLASLEKDLLKEYNATTLDLNTLVKTRLDIYRKTKDRVILNFMESLLSKCHKVKHLVLSIAAPVKWIIESLGSTVDQLSTVWITDRYYNYDDPVQDSIRCGFLSSGITFILDVEAEHSDEEESYGQLKAMAAELPRHSDVNLVVMTTRIKQRIDVPEVLLPRFKKVCISAQGRDCGRLLAFASFENRSPLNVTHLSFVRCNVHANAFNLLSLAGKKRQLPCLSYLSFVDCEVKGKLSILFECVWPSLTHLSFHQTMLDESDVLHLTDCLTGSADCLTGSRFLPRLESLVWSFGDELDHQYGHEKKGLMAPVNNLQLMSTWRRPIDLVLPEIVKVPLERLTSLWLEDLNKEEYKKIVTTLNERRPSRLTALGISMWKHARLHKNTAVFVKNVVDQRQNWAVSWTALDPYDLDVLPAVNIPTLTELMLHRFICTMQHLYMVTKSSVLTRLTKLDISHSSGITGTLSILLCHTFPSFSYLTLRDCGLNYEDLRSLAYSQHKGRLPQLRHLDISANSKIVGKLSSLFEFDCTWNSLINLNVEGASSKCFRYLGEKVAGGCLISLENLSFSINEKTLSYQGGQWRRLTHLKVSSKVCETHTILSIAKQLVDQGTFPSLSVLTISSGNNDSDEDDTDTDTSAVVLAQALHSSPLGTYIYDVLDQITLRTQAFLGNFATKIHAVSSPDSTYNEILDEMATIESSLFAHWLRQDVPQSQRDQIQEAYKQHLLAMAPDKVTSRRSDSEKREKYFKGMEYKRALMTKNVSLFVCSKEFVSGW